MKRVELRVTGKVQAVGFRWYCQQRAIEYGITGVARNERDGSVTVLAQGNEADLALYIDSIHRGPTLANVVSVSTADRIAIIGERGFRTE